jgi:DNA mismatch endonuclease (patch repair protein)
MASPERRTDNLTPEQRRYTMSRVKAKDTRPEFQVRRLVFSLGYRYRLHDARLPGRPDLVFPARRKVIFVHGCFWHGHRCKSGRKRPKTNRRYWDAKLQRNKTRDRRIRAALARARWRTLVLWECQLESAPALQRRVRDFLEQDRRG